MMTMNTCMTRLRDQIARICSDRFLLAWNISLLVAVILPLITFGVARAGISQGDENRNQNQNQDDNYHSWWQFWKSNDNNEDQHGNAGQDEEVGAPWWCKFAIILRKCPAYFFFVDGSETQPCLSFFS